MKTIFSFTLGILLMSTLVLAGNDYKPKFDFNKDKIVDSQDFGLFKADLLANFGTMCKLKNDWCISDLNKDKMVDSQDFTIFKAEFPASFGDKK